MTDPVRILVIVAILLGNAFFVAAEYALVTARRSHLRELEALGDRRVTLALGLTHRPLRFVSSVQLGITAFSILLGAVGEPLLEHLFAPVPATTIAFLLAFAVLTLLHVTFGEPVPKAVALSRREQIALRLAVPLELFSLALSPFVWLLESVTVLLTRPFGFATPPADVAVETEQDIRLMVAQAEEAGPFCSTFPTWWRSAPAPKRSRGSSSTSATEPPLRAGSSAPVTARGSATPRSESSSAGARPREWRGRSSLTAAPRSSAATDGVSPRASVRWAGPSASRRRSPETVFGLNWARRPGARFSSCPKQRSARPPMSAGDCGRINVGVRIVEPGGGTSR
jgi:hypothetical protein